MSRLLSPNLSMCVSMCLDLHVPGGLCLALCLRVTLSAHAYICQCHGFHCQTNRGVPKASGVCSASNHVRCDKFKNSLHVRDPALAQQSLLTV